MSVLTRICSNCKKEMDFVGPKGTICHVCFEEAFDSGVRSLDTPIFNELYPTLARITYGG
jgi:predicted amidophosphoribosyltransferase